MERLNNIFGRTPPRHQQLSAPGARQSAQDMPGAPLQQGQRHMQTQVPPTRRPSREQMTQRGSQMPPGTMATNQYPAARTRSLPVQSDALPHQRYDHEFHESHPYNYAPTTRPLYRQSPPQHEAVTYQQRQHPLPQRTQSFPTQTVPSPTQSSHSYRYTDDCAPSLPADVMDEWEEEISNDDLGSMEYGDWEQRDDREVLVYQQPERDFTSPHHRRMTQPLNPQVVAEMNRERAHPPEALQAMRQTRAVTPRVATQEALQGTRQIRAVTPRMTTKTSAVPAPAILRGFCPKCKGAGFLRADVPYGHPNFGKPIRCECKEAEQREKRRQQLREMSNLHAFHEQAFNTFNPRIPGVQEAYQEAVTYAENPKGWLLLVGPNGCGKTHLAAAIANQSLDGGAVVLFAVVPDLLDHLRAAFAPTANEVYDQLFAKMREAELLVLDDLGSQHSSPWANEKLFQLLNYRYNMGMPTVVTANPKGLQGTDERIRSRLSDASLVIKVHLDRANDRRPHRTSRRSY